MIAADDYDIRLECQQTWQLRIQFLDHMCFASEITILACRICSLDMQIKEIKIIPILFECSEFVHNRFARHGDYLHPQQSCEAAIHRIDGDSGRTQAVQVTEGWKHWSFGESAQHDHIRRISVCQ